MKNDNDDGSSFFGFILLAVTITVAACAVVGSIKITIVHVDPPAEKGKP